MTGFGASDSSVYQAIESRSLSTNLNDPLHRSPTFFDIESGVQAAAAQAKN